jgi:hypothetical protein
LSINAPSVPHIARDALAGPEFDRLASVLPVSADELPTLVEHLHVPADKFE